MPADSAALAALPWGSTADWEPSRATVKPLLSSVSALAAWMPVRVPSAPRSSASMFQPPTLYSPTSTPSSVVPSAAFTSKSTFPSAVSAYAEPATPVASGTAADAASRAARPKAAIRLRRRVRRRRTERLSMAGTAA